MSHRDRKRKKCCDQEPGGSGKERGNCSSGATYHSLSSVSTLRASIWYCHPSPPTRRNWIPCSGRSGTLRILISNRTTNSLPELISNKSSMVIEPLGPGVGGATVGVGGAPAVHEVLPVVVPCMLCSSCTSCASSS